MLDHGHYGCYYVCVNATRFESCPSPRPDLHQLVLLHEPCGGRSAGGAAGGGAAEPPGAEGRRDDEHEHRRRLAAGFGEYLKHAFSVQGHQTITVTTRHDKRVQEDKHQKEREAFAAGDAAATALKTKDQFEKKLFDAYPDGDTVSKPNGFACRISRTVGGEGGAGATDNIATRYFDNICLMQTAAQRSDLGARASAYVSTASKTWATQYHAQHRRALGEARYGDYTTLAHTLIGWSELMRIKSDAVHHVRHDRRLAPADKIMRITDIFHSSSRHLDAVHATLGTHAPYTASLHMAVNGLSAGMARFRDIIETEFPTEKTRRRRSLAAVTKTMGIFEPVVYCTARQYTCPDHTCVAAKSKCVRPAGVHLGWVASVEWTVLDVAVLLEDLGDLPTLMYQAQQCWAGYRTNPSLDPYSLGNVMLDDDEKTNVIWCFPYFEPTLWRVQVDTFDLRTWVQDNCNIVEVTGSVTVSVPTAFGALTGKTVEVPTTTVVNACTCNAYYDAHLVWDIDDRWVPGVGIYMYARLHNGLMSAQFVLTGLTRGGLVDRFWQAMFPPAYYPLWWTRLFGDQGHPGSTNQQYICAVTHLGSAFYLVFAVLVWALIAWAFAKPILAIVAVIYKVIDGVLSFFVSGEFLHAVADRQLVLSVEKQLQAATVGYARALEVQQEAQDAGDEERIERAELNVAEFGKAVQAAQERMERMQKSAATKKNIQVSAFGEDGRFGKAGALLPTHNAPQKGAAAASAGRGFWPMAWWRSRQRGGKAE